ncbi:MAG: TIGR00282 family metallophosphoesterase [Dehalogenimonas sp.]|uniref:TIGR00282 family metallophosphoesterase n=1 Tax=Candidatus Dehalogenimonas loeffleri TaxID=3127115 RepID=A0ABZ2J5V8_9CHLR|nr:TIGR00282 family metallophosphoesterase [Dehalogenimonas sp.]
MKILCIGDIIGKPGRRAVKEILPALKLGLGVEVVIANGENASGGIGLTPDVAEELFSYGVNAITSGNHIWSQSEILPMLEGDDPVVRPLNYPPGVPGKACTMVKGVMVVSLMGRTFINNLLDCPFRAMDLLLETVADRPKHIVVDFHAEATSEKQAMGWYLDGRVTAVVGTHTHVGTVDTRVLPGGTATVADIGMVGPWDSIIGDSKDDVLRRFLTGLPNRLSVGKGRVSFNSVLITTDAAGRALSIERVDRETAALA